MLLILYFSRGFYMEIFITFLTIIVFPFLSPLFVVEKNLDFNFESIQDWHLTGIVQGAEYVKNNHASKASEKSPELTVKENPIDLLPAPSLQPKRKQDKPDLVLPNAHASLILDVDSGTILHYDKGKEERQIASLTKLMTALLVMEEIEDLNEPVTIDEEAVYVVGTKIGCPRSGYCVTERLKVGEQVRAKDLLKAMLMNSANDAAVALAKHIGGTQDLFASMMNKRAKQMGLANSNFCTASGLEKDGKESECYSSAYDIARIAVETMKHDLIWELFRLPEATISSVDGVYTHKILNTDIVLGQVPNLLGGKTGFTPLAGQSLLMASTDPKGKHKIIAVVLDDIHRWQDIKTMFEWAFDAHEWR